MKTFIYALIDPRNQQIKYIGKANNPKLRFNGHLRECLKTETLKNNWIKSLLNKGLKPIVEIIDEVLESEWQFWERHYISLYKSWGFKLKNDPKCPGGDCGPTMKGKDNPAFGKPRLDQRGELNPSKRPEVRKKISDSKKGDNNPMKRKELRDKQSTLMLSRSDFYRAIKSKKVKQLTKEGVFIKEWNSAKEAELALGGGGPGGDNIGACARKKQRTAYSFVWVYVEN